MKTTGLKKLLQKVSLVYVVLVFLVITVLVIRLVLPGIVKNYVNKKLNELPGYTGHVDDIDIHLLRGAYVIKGLLLKKKTDPAKYPFLQIPSNIASSWTSTLLPMAAHQFEVSEDL